MGPAYGAWYVVLDRVFGTGGASITLKKVLLDQLLFSPVFVPVFLVFVGFLQGQPWADIERTVRRDFLPVLTASYVLWPAAQGVTFRFVPLNYQLPFTSLVALVWNTYLAWKANETPTV